MYERTDAIAPDTPRVLVRDAVFDLLRGLGITTIFGNPGSTELPLLKNMPQDFRYVLGLQECVVMGMADGFAQANRNAAFVNLHAAAGLGHSLGNLFTAWKNHTPIIVTAGQQARSLLQLDPFLFAQSATDFPKPYVKWACEPARAEDVPAALMRAYSIAMQPPRGPVFVSIPVDDWEQPCAPVTPRAVSQPRLADPASLARVGALLDAAARPVFVVGDDIGRDAAFAEIVALAERHNAPVWEGAMDGRCNFPQSHPLFAGFLVAAREPVVAALDGHDLILVLGAPAFIYHVEGHGPMLPEGAELVQIINNPDIAAWAQIGQSLVSDLKLGIAALLDRAPPTRKRQRPEGRAAAPVLSPAQGLTDRFVFQTLAKIRPADSIIVEEAPSARPPMQQYCPVDLHDGFYAGASGGLGHALPAAIGVAMARPGQRVIGIIGDGSSMYAIQGLWSAANLDLPITFLIFKNGAYEALLRFGRFFGMQDVPGARFPDLDFGALARGMSCEALRVERAMDLEPTLRQALSASRPTVVEILLD